MAMSDKLETLRKELDEIVEQQKKYRDHVEVVYNFAYGLGIKIDILQAIVLETINELAPEVKAKVLNDSNFNRIVAECQEVLEKRMDAIGWKEDAETAPVRQFIEDQKRADKV